MKNFKTKFFSILGASLLTAGLYSCSDEEANHLHQEDVKTENSVVVSKPLPPIENEIDEMFYGYVTSPIFIELRGMIIGFNEDLNYNGHLEDIDTDDELFSWISENLSITGFSSVSEAQARWNHIGVLVDVEYASFPSVYEYYRVTPVSEVSITIDKWFPIDNSISLTATCYDVYKGCRKEASDNFAQSAVQLSQEYHNEEISEMQKSVRLRDTKKQ